MSIDSDLTKKVQQLTKEIGFDICAPFPVQKYNDTVSKRFPLPTFSNNSPTAYVIAANYNFWPFLVDWLTSRSHSEEVLSNPVDSYVDESIKQMVSKNFSDYETEIRFDWDTPFSGKFVHIQTAGHFAGVGNYDKEVGWSIHPEFGMWFIYRAVIIFNVPWEGREPKILEPLLTKEEQNILLELTETATQEKWANKETRLKIRDVAHIGKQYRYTGDCLNYFYPIHNSTKEIIEKIIQNK